MRKNTGSITWISENVLIDLKENDYFLHSFTYFIIFFYPCFFLFLLQGWWLVDREGELGWAPASHLEPTDDGSEITTSNVFAPGKGTLNCVNNEE